MARLPSLNALRAFEAAARTGSVTAAARALSVTPGAVSRQIKLLESDLGVVLLERDGRGVAPTGAARAGLAALGLAFEQIESSVDAMRRAGQSNVLVVSVVPSFASRWLVPRLERFWARAPDVDVRVETKWGLADFRRDAVDLAIRFGTGHYPGLHARALMDEEYFPVCSPRLAERGPLATPADLRHHVLLHVDFDFLGPDFPSWRMWLRSAGVEDDVDHRRGPRFQVSDLALEAARQSQGVALGSTALVADDLRYGWLVRPFGQSIVAPFAYHVVCPPANLERAVVAGFVDWLVEEAASFA